MRSPVGISGLQAGKDAGKKQRRTVINLGRRDLLVDPPGTRLAIEATHFAQMDHRCCCPSSCLADIAAARFNSPLRSAASLPTSNAAEQSNRSDSNSASM